MSESSLPSVPSNASPRYHYRVPQPIVLGTLSIDSSTSSPRHIAFGIDEGYMRGVSVSIASLASNTTSALIVHIFYSGELNDPAVLVTLTEQFNVQINVYPLDKALFDGFPVNDLWTCSIYYRALVGKALKDVTDRVVYIDADIICTNDFSELYTVDLQGKVVGVVRDHDRKTREDAQALYGVSDYFNSGVLVIDPVRWEEERISEQFIDTLRAKGDQLRLFDQDALNIVLEGKTRFLPAKFNAVARPRRYRQKDLMPVPLEECVLVHFIGNLKPWRHGSFGRSVDAYEHYEAMTPWEDTPKDPPYSGTGAKRYANAFFQRKRWLQGIYWYGYYLQLKFVQKRR